MKKPSPKHIFLAIIALAILIPLLIFGWNELQKKPLDITMYGAEITRDGTVIQQTQFQLAGYLTDAKTTQIIPYPSSYMIYLEPMTFEGTQPLDSVIHPCENPMLITGNIHHPYYTVFLTGTKVNNGDFREWRMYLCNNLCHCIITAGGRIFVGSVKPDENIEQILDYFPEDILS